jgi:hypothetical protein
VRFFFESDIFSSSADTVTADVRHGALMLVAISGLVQVLAIEAAPRSKTPGDMNLNATKADLAAAALTGLISALWKTTV